MASAGELPSPRRPRSAHAPYGPCTPRQYWWRRLANTPIPQSPMGSQPPYCGVVHVRRKEFGHSSPRVTLPLVIDRSDGLLTRASATSTGRSTTNRPTDHHYMGTCVLVCGYTGHSLSLSLSPPSSSYLFLSESLTSKERAHTIYRWTARRSRGESRAGIDRATRARSNRTAAPSSVWRFFFR